MALRAQAHQHVNGLSLCSGIGGIELGIADAIGPGYRTVAYVEGEAYAAAVLAARMQDGSICDAPIWGDVKTFDPAPWRGIVDIITAGYPCQPFSHAGRRRGTEDPRHLWPHIAQIIESIKPAVVFCENVPGHLTLGLEQVCEELCAMGYAIEAGIFSAFEIGAPHLRKRLFFVAYADRKHLRQQSGRWQWRAQGQDALQLADYGSQESVAHAEGPRQQTRSGYAIRAVAAQQSGSAARAACPPRSVANAYSQGRLQPRRSFDQVRQWAGDGGQTLANAAGTRCAQGQPKAGQQGQRQSGLQQPLRRGWWSSEPSVGRMVDGCGHRVDRLRCLGNAVVPACAAHAFTTLMRQAAGNVTSS